MKPILLFVGLMALAAGCATHPALIGPDEPVPHDPEKGRTIDSAACGFNFGGYIGTNTPTVYRRAVGALRERAPFDYITNIEMQVYWRWAVIGTRHCVLLKAIAYPPLKSDPTPAAPPAPGTADPTP